MATAPYPRFAGTDLSFDSYTPLQLFSGDRDVTTNTGTLVSGQNLAQYAVVARDTGGKLTAHVPAAVDSTANAVGILCDAVNATAGDRSCRFYDGGSFNPAALVWHVDSNTVAEQIAAFDGTAIQIRTLG